jgi:hypothetical protein
MAQQVVNRVVFSAVLVTLGGCGGGSPTSDSGVLDAATDSDAPNGDADGGGFATPDILDNASFEADWSSFVDFSGTAPEPSAPDSNGYSVNRSQDFAYRGTWSAKVTFGPNPGGDDAVQFAYDFTNQAALVVYARAYFYLVSNIPNNFHKWMRFHTAGFNGSHGGLFLATNTGGMTWNDVAAMDVANDIGVGIPTFNTWHSIEVEYDRTNWATTGARARFWYDGVQTVGSNSGPPSYTASVGWGHWGDETGAPANGPWLYAGAADTVAAPSAILDFDDTINQGNSNSGACYYDWIAISTQRIGP